MDCDCELLHNEPPSIPLYLSFLFFFFFLTSPVILRSAFTRTHTRMYTLCMHMLVDAATCIARGCRG